MGSHLKMQPMLQCLSPFKAFKKTKTIFILVSFICFHSFLFAQEQKVTGKITDEKAQPLAGATVKISGSNIGCYN